MTRATRRGFFIAPAEFTESVLKRIKNRIVFDALADLDTKVFRFLEPALSRLGGPAGAAVPLLVSMTPELVSR
jgi:hypothetical protein